MKRIALKLGCAALGLGIVHLNATDWSQYRGPNHDGISSEKILSSWPAGGPPQIWKTPLTDGFSSLSVSSGKVFTLVARMIDGAKQEVCVALDAATGNELWAAPIGIAKYDGGGDSGTPSNSGGDGPRSTPSIDDGRVYAYSARLGLFCLDASTGKVIWSKDLLKEHDGKNISWQNASSPLIEGNLVLVSGGGPNQSFLAFDKKDGHLVWKGQSEKLTHATPVAATILGVRQVIFFTQSGLVSVKPGNGEVLWRHPFKYSVSTAASPVVADNIVYCSAGYGVGASACRISKSDSGFTATQIWFKPAKDLNNHWSTPVAKDGYLYGLFGFKEYGSCPLKCVELATGKEMWSKSGFGPGGCVWVNGNILTLSDAGELVLVQAAPEKYTEVARAKALAGKCWSSPAVSNGRVYARSTKEGVCMDFAQPNASLR